ncbi:universal stress protein [Rhodococcus gannanensis]|uniref:Universal stress protein n=1 Tax=Rhodococcus gannanensis TaxID=1960308 RepID=A0ABW4P2S6_9NOCA
MIGDSAFTRDLWLSKPDGASSYAGTVVLGCNGSDASLRLIEAAPRICSITGGVVLVCAVSPWGRAPWERHPDAVDVLKGEAHLLDDATDSQLALELGRAAAREAGLNLVAAVEEPGDPVRSLLRAADRYRAAAILVGMRDERPSRQVNRLARRLPDGLDLVASNGSEHLLARTRNRARARSFALFPAAPRPSEA